MVDPKDEMNESTMGRLARIAHQEVIAAGRENGVITGAMGSYRIESLLAKGGMGAMIHLARNEEDGKHVVLKLLPRFPEDRSGLVKRFRREAKAMLKVRHPNVVRFLDCGETAKGNDFIVMDYIRTGSLAKRLSDGVPFGVDDAFRFIATACRGLAAFHQEGIIHRDIKPSNILVGRNGEPKLCDLGLAKIIRSSQQSSPLTQAGDKLGTFGYMAPEQLDSMTTLSVDQRADIYGLGGVLYYMLTRKVPSGALSPPSKYNENLKPYDTVIMKALRTAPEDRYQSAEEFREALVGIFGEPPRSLSRRKLLTGFAGATVVASGAAWFGLVASRKSRFWADIARAQDKVSAAGQHDVSIKLSGNKFLRFFVTLTSEPPSYKLQPIDIPDTFHEPFQVETLLRLAQSGAKPGLLARLTVQSLQVIMPDRPAERVPLSNLPTVEGKPTGLEDFLLECRLLDQLHEADVLEVDENAKIGLRLNPRKCEDFSAFCRLSDAQRSPLVKALSTEGRVASLRRFILYELLWQKPAKRHPALNELPSVRVENVVLRSRFEMVGALVAEGWLMRILANQGLLRGFESVYLPEGNSDDRNSIVRVVDTLLLD